MNFPPDGPPDPRRIEEIDEWIPLDDCEDGRLYRVECRNAQWGIFQEDEDGFLIARRHHSDGVRLDPSGQQAEAFEEGDLYRFVEKHYDVGEPHGTAKPFELIDEVPDPDFELLCGLPDARRDTGIKHQFDVEKMKEMEE